MKTVTFTAISFGYIFFGFFFGYVTIEQLQLFSGVVLTHNLTHFVEFWFAVGTLWSAVYVGALIRRYVKKTAKYREKEISFSYIANLMFLGFLLFADVCIFQILFLS